MRRCRFVFAGPILVFAAFSSVASAADWSVRVTPFGGIYPSLELSQARRSAAATPGTHTLGSGSGLLAVTLAARHAGEQVVLTTRIAELDHSYRFAADLAQANERYELYPPLQWNESSLQPHGAPVSAHIEFSLTRDGVASGTREERVTIHPFDEALYFVRDGADTVDLSWIFAAYVDENDPVVDTILDRAKASGIVDDIRCVCTRRCRCRRCAGLGDLARDRRTRYPLFERRSVDPARAARFQSARASAQRNVERSFRQLHRRQRADRIGVAADRHSQFPRSGAGPRVSRFLYGCRPDSAQPTSKPRCSAPT